MDDDKAVIKTSCATNVRIGISSENQWPQILQIDSE